ncbi:MAG: hypothetical protein RL085_365, partial [Actinomycetota bacterium]
MNAKQPIINARVVSLFFFTLAALALGATVAIQIGGAAKPFTLLDPGDLVRWGLPLSRAFLDVTMATTIGALAIAAFVFSEGSAKLRTTMNIAAGASVLWVISGMLSINFTYLNVTGLAFNTEQSYGAGLWQFVTQVDLGIYLSLSLVGALVVSILAIASQRLTAAAIATAVGFLSLVPIALTGHASGTANHSMAVNSLGLHLLAVTLWVGGLITLALVRVRRDVSGEEVARFSSIALFSFALVLVSGLINAQLRIGSVENWLSNYGFLVLLKIGALAVLGVFGALYRRRLIARIDQQPSAFWRVVGAEVAVMAAAVGIAAALSR